MSDAPQAVSFNAAEGVDLVVDDSSDDETFSIKVMKGTDVLEEHDGVTTTSAADIGSDHFSVETVEPPKAPEDPGPEDAAEGEPEEAEGGTPGSESEG